MSVELSLSSVFLASVFLSSVVLAQPDLIKDQRAVMPPAAVGATAEEADIIFWFVATDVVYFSDSTWAEHKELLELLEANSIRARIEHQVISQFDELWKEALKEERLPNFLVGNSPSGPFRGLMADGVVRDVVSTRLHSPDATSSCSDFKQLSRIWQVLNAPNSDLAERAIATLLEPRSATLLGPVAELSNVERVLLTTKVKTVAQAWFKYDFDELEKYWHERSPQRSTSKSIDKEFAKSESEYRKSTQFRKVQFYGNSNLITAMVDAVTRVEPREQPDWFVSKSCISQSPVCVMLAKVAGEYRVLLVGTWRYEVNIDDDTAESLLSFTNTDPNAVTEAEILEPADRTVLGNDDFKVRWKSSSLASPNAPLDGNVLGGNFFFIQRHRDGNFSVKRLVIGKEFETCVRGDSELAIWNIPSSGQIEFSKVVHLGYDPNLDVK